MEWTRGPTIGRGSSAAVSLATAAAGHLFAVKSADVTSSSSLQNEQSLISQLCSPFIVRCLGSDITYEKNKSVFNLFLEYVPGGTLSDLVRTQGGSLGENAIQFYTRQLLEGLNYLHLNGIAHCDIKGQNILVGGGDGLKIVDFGCAKWVECGGGSISGTPAYMAPEVARGEEQGFPADIWALGCTIIEMATGTNPWPEMKDPAAALYRVGYSGDVPEFPHWFSGAGRDFLGKCLMRDSNERWTAAELLDHPFLNSVEVNGGEIRDKLAGKSPTSVMDQGFWDAVEVSSDSSANPTTEIASSLISPAVRIRGLVGDSFSSNLNFGVWCEEEDWVVVRSHDNEDCAGEEEIQTSAALEDPFFNYSSDDEINVVSTFPVNFSESSKDDSVSEIFNFQRIVVEIYSHSDQFFIQSCRAFLSLL